MGHINLKMDANSISGVLSTLDAYGELEPRARAALEKGAEILLPVVVSKTPVRTGKLKSAVKIGKRKKVGARLSVEVGAFYPETSIAHLVEHGHGGPHPAGAHPFVAPAVDEVGEAAMQAVMDELMRGI